MRVTDLHTEVLGIVHSYITSRQDAINWQEIHPVFYNVSERLRLSLVKSCTARQDRPNDDQLSARCLIVHPESRRAQSRYVAAALRMLSPPDLSLLSAYTVAFLPLDSEAAAVAGWMMEAAGTPEKALQIFDIVIQYIGTESLAREGRKDRLAWTVLQLFIVQEEHRSVTRCLPTLDLSNEAADAAIGLALWNRGIILDLVCRSDLLRCDRGKWPWIHRLVNCYEKAGMRDQACCTAESMFKLVRQNTSYSLQCARALYGWLARLSELYRQLDRSQEAELLMEQYA